MYGFISSSVARRRHVHWLLVVSIFLLVPNPTLNGFRSPAAGAAIASEDASDTMRRGAELYRTGEAVSVAIHRRLMMESIWVGERDLPTMFGVFYAPNISSHETQGIGDWTEDDFYRAMREGRAPDGRRYWPTFPYMTYTNMSDEDIHAFVGLYACPTFNEEPSIPHRVKVKYRLPGLMAVWQTIGFRSGPLEADATQSDEWNRVDIWFKRSAIVTNAIRLGIDSDCCEQRRHMAGGANPGKADVHPNLTPAVGVGLADWTEEAIAHYLATGEKPDGSVTPEKDIMAEKIHESFQYYNEADRLAIEVFLRSLEPNDFDPSEWSVVRRERRKAERASQAPSAK